MTVSVCARPFYQALGMLLFAILAVLLLGCEGDNTPVPGDTPGLGPTPISFAPTPVPPVAAAPEGATAPVVTTRPESDAQSTPAVLTEAETRGEPALSEPPVEAAEEKKGPSIHKRESYDYQKLDSEIAKQASLFEHYRNPQAEGSHGETLAYFPVMVSIDLVGDPRPTFKLLEENGVSYVRNEEDGTCIPPPSSYCLIPQHNGELRMDAELSISILAPLSLQPDVKSINRWAAFPNLEFPLKELLTTYSTGLNPYRFSERVAGLRPAHVSVAICWQVGDNDAKSPDHIRSVIEWLKSNGGHPNAMLSYKFPYTDLPADPSTIRIYELVSSVPISELTKLSSQVGNVRVTGGSCESSGGDPDGHLPFCCAEYSKHITVGDSQDFVLLSNLTVVDKLLLELEEGEEGGKAAIGSCDDAGSDTLLLSHGDTVTIAACSPGAATLRLYDGDNVAWDESLTITELDANRPILQQEPPYPNAPTETSIYSVYHLGESITLRLEAPNAEYTDFRVGINEESYTTDTTDTGNLSFGDCPGQVEDSIRMRHDDTVTVTACSPGFAPVTAWYWSESNGREVNSPFALSIWGPPHSYPVRNREN